MLNLINYSWLRAVQCVLGGSERTITHRNGGLKHRHMLNDDSLGAFYARHLKLVLPCCQCCLRFALSFNPLTLFFFFIVHSIAEILTAHAVTKHTHNFTRQLLSLWIFQQFMGHWGLLCSIIHALLYWQLFHMMARVCERARVCGNKTVQVT